MAELMLNPGETFVKRLNVNYVVKNWAFPIIGISFKSGILFLTSERIVLHKRSTLLFYLGGVLAYASNGKFAFEIPLKQLRELHRKKVGLLGSALRVVTRDGNEHLFVIKSGEFIKALEDSLAAHHKSRLICDADSHWIIETAS